MPFFRSYSSYCTKKRGCPLKDNLYSISKEYYNAMSISSWAVSTRKNITTGYTVA